MIDINDPKSEYIFKAARYTDQIKDFCRIYILQNYNDRKETFQKMKQECESLKVFSKKHFSENGADIFKVSDELISEIERLETINNTTEQGNCNVCNTKLKTFDSLIKEVGMITICEKCPSTIYDCIYKLDCLTGASFI